MLGPVYDLHMLAEGLSDNGNEVFAFDPGTYEGQVARVSRYIETTKVSLVSPSLGDLDRIKIPLFRGSRLERHVNRYLVLYEALEELVQRENFDVIVIYSAARTGVQAVKLGHKYKIPLVFRNVDMLNKLWPTRLERWAVRQQERYIYKRVQKLCALTPTYADYLISLNAKRENVELLLFPLDLSQFDNNINSSEIREKWGISATSRVLVFIGTLYEFGGMDLFVKQMPRLLEMLPDIVLLIVGDGPILSDLKRLVIELDLEGKVILTGHEPFELMAQYVNAADIGINVFRRNKHTNKIFSAKIIQYLACGRPVISSSLEGISTLIPEEKGGVVYQESPENIADAVIELANSKDRCESLGEAGRRYVLENHSAVQIVQKMEAILKALVERDKSVSRVCS